MRACVRVGRFHSSIRLAHQRSTFFAIVSFPLVLLLVSHLFKCEPEVVAHSSRSESLQLYGESSLSGAHTFCCLDHHQQLLASSNSNSVLSLDGLLRVLCSLLDRYLRLSSAYVCRARGCCIRRFWCRCTTPSSLAGEEFNNFRRDVSTARAPFAAMSDRLPAAVAVSQLWKMISLFFLPSVRCFKKAKHLGLSL